MARKRSHNRKKNIFGFDKKGHKGRGGSPKMQNSWMKIGGIKIFTDDIIGFVLGNGGEASSQEILGSFGLGRSHRKNMHALLNSMCHDKLLYQGDDNQYRVKRSGDYLTAILSVNPRGFAFAQLTPLPRGWKFQDDAFVGQSNIGTAMHGDEVLIKIIGNRGDRAEAKIIRVIKRAVVRIVGIYRDTQPEPHVVPEDVRYPFTIRITGETGKAQEGDAVVAVITEHDSGKGGRPKGEIIEVLGDPDSLMVQTELVIRKFDLPHLFSKKTKKQLKKIDSKIEVGQNRTDLRDVLHITIDGETARDFDDAVAVQKTKNGYQLHVSIADVSHYVQENSPLDRDAYERGTSVYFPTKVLPMLPEALSNDLCSLVPNKDRYAFTAILDFDRTGSLKNKRVMKSVIKSHYRMTYNLVSEILIEKNPKTRKEFKPLLTPLKWMEDLANALLKKRMARGSIGFELPEAIIEVSGDDQVVDIRRSERNFAHQIIEEFMLAANEAVARTMTDNELTKGLYRVHEIPDKQKVTEFRTFAKTMGMKLPRGDAEPRWFGQVLKLTVGQPQEYIVNNLLLRTMKQARYSPENVGHFGLAASHYSHFTSPIRRYPDLMVHRALAEFLSSSSPGGSAKKKKKSKKGGSLPVEAGNFLSKRERVAVDAEREVIDRMKVRYMEDKVGETFQGIISGVTSFGLFIELMDSFISGGVPIGSIKDDYYYLDEKSHRLIGKRLHKSYQIGDLVVVKLDSVEKARRRINFELVDEQED